jgi:hypothetical protein
VCSLPPASPAPSVIYGRPPRHGPLAHITKNQSDSELPAITALLRWDCYVGRSTLTSGARSLLSLVPEVPLMSRGIAGSGMSVSIVPTGAAIPRLPLAPRGKRTALYRSPCPIKSPRASGQAGSWYRLHGRVLRCLACPIQLSGDSSSHGVCHWRSCPRWYRPCSLCSWCMFSPVVAGREDGFRAEKSVSGKIRLTAPDTHAAADGAAVGHASRIPSVYRRTCR